jgi:hypothetical protein
MWGRWGWNSPIEVEDTLLFVKDLNVQRDIELELSTHLEVMTVTGHGLSLRKRAARHLTIVGLVGINHHHSFATLTKSNTQQWCLCC